MEQNSSDRRREGRRERDTVREGGKEIEIKREIVSARETE